MSVEKVEKVVFPYTTLAQAIADKFAKLGGREQAFRQLKQGYKFLRWRKNYSTRKQAELKRILAKAKEIGLHEEQP